MSMGGPRIVIIGGGIGKVAQLAVTVARRGLRRPDGTFLMCIPDAGTREDLTR